MFIVKVDFTKWSWENKKEVNFIADLGLVHLLPPPIGLAVVVKIGPVVEGPAGDVGPVWAGHPPGIISLLPLQHSETIVMPNNQKSSW